MSRTAFQATHLSKLDITNYYSSVKVRMQTAVIKQSMGRVIRDTLKNEGPFAFYKGVGPPLVTVPLVNSIVFSGFEFCKRLMKTDS